MLDFHHNYIENKYGDKTEMLLTGTDSLMYKTCIKLCIEYETEHFNENLNKSKEFFDFSNCPKDLKCQTGANNLVEGKMRDETSGVPKKFLQD